MRNRDRYGSSFTKSTHPMSCKKENNEKTTQKNKVTTLTNRKKNNEIVLCRNIDCTLQCDVTYVVKTDLYLLVVSPWVALNSTCDNLGRNHHRTATDPVGNKCSINQDYDIPLNKSED